MTVVLVRALHGGDGFEATIVSALAWMATLGLVGLIVGAIAQATVDESVRDHMERELAAEQPVSRVSDLAAYARDDAARRTHENGFSLTIRLGRPLSGRASRRSASRRMA